MSGQTWSLLNVLFTSFVLIVFVLLLFLLKNNFIILEFKSVINGEEERVFIT